MSFQWLTMRITEESERREREANIRQRLPEALEEVRAAMENCVELYTQRFGADSAELQISQDTVRLIAREEQDGRWKPRAQVDVTAVLSLPGFHIEQDGQTLEIVVGILPGENLFYRDAEKYLTMEELSRRILDKALFPKLGE
jgi:hypothetical protein